MVPPEQVASTARAYVRAWPRSQLDPDGPHPRWDGMGVRPRPIGMVAVGKEDDFGQVHYSYAKLYIEEVSVLFFCFLDC